MPAVLETPTVRAGGPSLSCSFHPVLSLLRGHQISTFFSEFSSGRAVAPKCGRALPGLYAERTDSRPSTSDSFARPIARSDDRVDFVPGNREPLARWP